jgi:hypothetical protein
MKGAVQVAEIDMVAETEVVAQGTAVVIKEAEIKAEAIETEEETETAAAETEIVAQAKGLLHHHPSSFYKEYSSRTFQSGFFLLLILKISDKNIDVYIRVDFTHEIKFVAGFKIQAQDILVIDCIISLIKITNEYEKHNHQNY